MRKIRHRPEWRRWSHESDRILAQRPVLQRIAGWAVPAAGLLYKGRGVECPVCGAKYRKFMPYGYVQSRPNALCPKCLSLERHRLLWLYLTRETDLLTAFPRTLHIAPEVCIMRHLKPHFQPASGTIRHGRPRKPAGGHPFRRAADPAGRRFGGRGDLQSHSWNTSPTTGRRCANCTAFSNPAAGASSSRPVDRDYERTYEDDSITDPDERTRIFGQYDHRRIYGADYADRLREAGFEAADIDYAATFTDEPSAGYTPCRPITCMWFTKSDRRPSKRLSDGNRPTAIRGLVLPWKSLPQVIRKRLWRGPARRNKTACSGVW